VLYGHDIRAKQGDADVEVSGLWIADAKDGSGAVRLTACANSACDEHSAAWSPDGAGTWVMHVSHYPKLRLDAGVVVRGLEKMGLDVVRGPGPRGMVQISAVRRG
jgi:hypothetical protein